MKLKNILSKISIPENEWSYSNKILFKFSLIYFLLFINPLSFLYQDLVILFGELFIQIESEIDTSNTGSGDKLIHWLYFLFNLASAFIGTIIWTAIDRNNISYNKLAELLYVIVRYYLALVLIGYGIVKIIPSQFQEPGFIRLTEEFGNSSPMSLAWTFFGFKDGYQMFSGTMEAFGGIMILFRRTTLFGALLSIGVMLNVFMVNLFFDVPVKLFSGHLLIFCIGLVFLNYKSLVDYFFIHNHVKQSLRPLPIIDSDWRNIIYTLKGIIISGIIGIMVYATYSANSIKPDAPEIAGIYHIDSFQLNKEEVIPSLNDPLRWKRLVVDDLASGLIAIDLYGGGRIELEADINEQSDSLVAQTPTGLNFENNKEQLLSIEYVKTDSTLSFNGTLGGLPFTAQMTKRELDDILLISRGFNLVNEFPLRR